MLSATMMLSAAIRPAAMRQAPHFCALRRNVQAKSHRRERLLDHQGVVAGAPGRVEHEPRNSDSRCFPDIWTLRKARWTMRAGKDNRKPNDSGRFGPDREKADPSALDPARQRRLAARNQSPV